jgi:FkbM family methyltransferase
MRVHRRMSLSRSLKLSEPFEVRIMRLCLRHWPLARGRGALMRLMGPRLRRYQPAVFECEPGLFITGDLNDWVVQWSFAGEPERDAAFQLSLSLLRRGSVVLDIGANIGRWTLSAARRVGPRHVHAFEPVPQLYEALVQHVELNQLSEVQCHQVALGDRRDTTTFFVATHGNSGGSGLASRPGVEEPVQVTMATLDHYREKEDLARVDFMKVDVEGAETLVFSGGHCLLRAANAPAIMFESSACNAALFGKTQADVRLQLESLGYQIFRFDGKCLSLVVTDQPSEDLFAFKAQHFERDDRLRALASRGSRKVPDRFDRV